MDEELSEYIDVEVSWVLISVDASKCGFLIQYYFGGPVGPPLRISVQEDDELIRVSVYMKRPRVVQGFTSDGRGGQASVKLERPIGGRPIVGATREQMRRREYLLWDDRGNSRLVVPRVLGLGLYDAEAVLRSQYFEPVVCGDAEDHVEVVSQTPLPETPIPKRPGPRGRVQLTPGYPSHGPDSVS